MPFPALDLTEYTRIRLDQLEGIRTQTREARRKAAPPQTAAGLRLASMFPEFNRVCNCGRVWREYLLENPGGSTETYWQQTRCKSRYCPRCARIFGKELLTKLTDAEVENPAPYTTLLTLTFGPTVYARELAERYTDLQAAWKLFRKAMPGMIGGIYSYESTISKGKYHLHLHVYAQFDDSVWLRWDNNYLRITKTRTQAFTPAWLYIMGVWERCVEKIDPKSWSMLRPTGIDPEISGDPAWQPWQVKQARECKAGRVDIQLPRRFVSIDIGGRTPSLPENAPWYASKDGKWIPLDQQQDPRRRREIIAKYVIRFDSDEVSTRLAPVMRLFRGKRRIQPFGNLFGKLPSRDIQQEPRKGIPTGRHAVCAVKPSWDMIDATGEHWAAFWTLDEEPAPDIYIYRPHGPLTGYHRRE